MEEVSLSRRPRPYWVKGPNNYKLVVSAREVYDFLGKSSSHYARWLKTIIFGHGQENIHYRSTIINSSGPKQYYVECECNWIYKLLGAQGYEVSELIRDSHMVEPPQTALMIKAFRELNHKVNQILEHIASPSKTISLPALDSKQAIKDKIKIIADTGVTYQQIYSHIYAGLYHQYHFNAAARHNNLPDKKKISKLQLCIDKGQINNINAILDQWLTLIT